MKKSELGSTSDEVLEKSLKQRKTVMGIFIVIILALLYFFLRDLFMGKEMDLPIFIIIITSIGGLLSVFLEYKAVKKELVGRK